MFLEMANGDFCFDLSNIKNRNRYSRCALYMLSFSQSLGNAFQRCLILWRVQSELGTQSVSICEPSTSNITAWNAVQRCLILWRVQSELESQSVSFCEPSASATSRCFLPTFWCILVPRNAPLAFLGPRHARFSFSDLCFCFPKVALKFVLGCFLTRNIKPCVACYFFLLLSSSYFFGFTPSPTLVTRDVIYE